MVGNDLLVGVVDDDEVVDGSRLVRDDRCRRL